MVTRFTKEDGELGVVEEDVRTTQKLLRQWLSTNYSIVILNQSVNSSNGKLVTTLIRKKLG